MVYEITQTDDGRWMLTVADRSGNRIGSALYADGPDGIQALWLLITGSQGIVTQEAI